MGDGISAFSRGLIQLILSIWLNWQLILVTPMERRNRYGRTTQTIAAPIVPPVRDAHTELLELNSR